MPKKTTTKKKTTKKANKKPIEDMEMADGRVEDKHKLSTDIEAILSMRGNNPFGTIDTEEFDEKVGEMNLSQMQELAVKASVFPSGNRTTLKNKLKREFKTKFGVDTDAPRFMSQTERPILDPDSAKAKEIMDILNS